MIGYSLDYELSIFARENAETAVTKSTLSDSVLISWSTNLNLAHHTTLGHLSPRWQRANFHQT